MTKNPIQEHNEDSSDDDEVEEVQTSKARIEEEQRQEDIRKAARSNKRKRRRKDSAKEKIGSDQAAITTNADNGLKGSDANEFDESFFGQLEKDNEETVARISRERIERKDAAKATKIVFPANENKGPKQRKLNAELEVVALLGSARDSLAGFNQPSRLAQICSRNKLLNGAGDKSAKNGKKEKATKTKNPRLSPWKRSKKTNLRLLNSIRNP